MVGHWLHPCYHKIKRFILLGNHVNHRRDMCSYCYDVEVHLYYSNYCLQRGHLFFYREMHVFHISAQVQNLVSFIIFPIQTNVKSYWLLRKFNFHYIHLNCLIAFPFIWYLSNCCFHIFQLLASLDVQVHFAFLLHF